MKNRKLITLGLLGALVLGGYSLPALAHDSHGYPAKHIKYKMYHAPHSYSYSGYNRHYRHGYYPWHYGYYPPHYGSHYYRPYRHYGHSGYGYRGHHTSHFAIKLHF